MELAAPASRFFFPLRTSTTENEAPTALWTSIDIWGEDKDSRETVRKDVSKEGSGKRRTKKRKKKMMMMMVTMTMMRRLFQTLARQETGREGAGRLDAKRWCCSNGLTATPSQPRRKAARCSLLVAPEYENMRVSSSSHMYKYHAWHAAQEQGSNQVRADTYHPRRRQMELHLHVQAAPGFKSRCTICAGVSHLSRYSVFV